MAATATIGSIEQLAGSSRCHDHGWQSGRHREGAQNFCSRCKAGVAGLVGRDAARPCCDQRQDGTVDGTDRRRGRRERDGQARR